MTASGLLTSDANLSACAPAISTETANPTSYGRTRPLADVDLAHERDVGDNDGQRQPRLRLGRASDALIRFVSRRRAGIRPALVAATLLWAMPSLAYDWLQFNGDGTHAGSNTVERSWTKATSAR